MNKTVWIIISAFAITVSTCKEKDPEKLTVPTYLSDFKPTSSQFGPYFLSDSPWSYGFRIIVWGNDLPVEICSMEADRQKYEMEGVGMFEITLNQTEPGEYQLITHEDSVKDSEWIFREEKVAILSLIRGGETISDKWDSLNEYYAYKGTITVSGPDSWSYDDWGTEENAKLHLNIHAGFPISDARTLQCDDSWGVDADGGVTSYHGECICLEPDGTESTCTDKDEEISCCPDPNTELAYLDFEIESTECGWLCIESLAIPTHPCEEAYRELYENVDTEECSGCESLDQNNIVFALSWSDGTGPLDKSMVTGRYVVSAGDTARNLEPEMCTSLPDGYFCTTTADGSQTSNAVDVRLELADGRTAEGSVEFYGNGCSNGPTTYQPITVEPDTDGAIIFEEPTILDPCDPDTGWM
jgi:hypothetical protein